MPGPHTPAPPPPHKPRSAAADLAAVLPSLTVPCHGLRWPCARTPNPHTQTPALEPPARAHPHFPAAAEPPPPSRVALGAPNHLHNTTSGLRMRRTTSHAKPQAKTSPRTPDSTNSSEPYAAPPRNRARRRSAPPPREPTHLSRRI